jgi:hypothetical protein
LETCRSPKQLRLPNRREYDSQLLNFAANKFLSQQPTYRLGCWRWSCPPSWGLRVETEVIYVGLCYWVFVLPRLMGYPMTIRNSDGIFQEKTVDTCIRWNKSTIISTNIFLFPYHFRLLPFPFHRFSYFSEMNLGRSGISVTVFTPTHP